MTCQYGKVKSALIFPVIIKEAIETSFHKSIEQYRFVQDGEDFILELVKGPDYNESISSTIEKVFHREIGEDVSFTIHFVDKIKRDPSGKKRFFIKKKHTKSS